MKTLLWTIILLALLSSCSEQANFTVVGTITNSLSDKVYLEKLDLNGTIPFDSAKIDSKGNFKLQGTVSEPTFFKMHLNQRSFVNLLIDSEEHVTFSADHLNFASEYKVDGSFGSKLVHDLNVKLANTNFKLDSLNAMIKHGSSGDDIKQAWIEEQKQIVRKQEEFSKNFINENPFSLASVMAIYQRYSDGSFVITDLQTIKVAASALNAIYPNSKHVKALYAETRQLMEQEKAIAMNNFVEQYGTNSPEITLPDANGKDISISTFKGKYVLLQFWASQNRASRIMNPVLKENYNKFKSKGFEIYQVSVDTVKTDWTTAIKEDGMNWTHVGDMNGCIEVLNAFNIRQIPYNYLLDKEGAIIAKDLKGPAIQRKLSEILN